MHGNLQTQDHSDLAHRRSKEPPEVLVQACTRVVMIYLMVTISMMGIMELMGILSIHATADTRDTGHTTHRIPKCLHYATTKDDVRPGRARRARLAPETLSLPQRFTKFGRNRDVHPEYQYPL